MDNCLFGNVIISRIYPGTVIEPHCGPTNVRHRLQFVLEMPSGTMPPAVSEACKTVNNKNDSLSLWIGHSTKVSWAGLNDVFVFDDSFLHSVQFSKSNDGCARRTVLIVDLWHPNLQEMERTMLEHLYPPFHSGAAK
jgi:hypothetical protein